MFRGKSREVLVFFRGLLSPPHADDLYPCPPWGISVTAPFILIPPLFLCSLRLLPSLSRYMALLDSFSLSVGWGGVCGFFPLFLLSLLLLSLSLFFLCFPVPCSLRFVNLVGLGYRGLANRCPPPAVS